MCWMQLLVAAFVAILFLQSGVDKVIDREGNSGFLREHFRTPGMGDTTMRFFKLSSRTFSGSSMGGGACAALLLASHCS